MKRFEILALVVAGLAVLGSRASFAEGQGISGRTPLMQITGGVGRSSSDGLTSLGFTSGTHAYGLGLVAGASSPHFNRSTDDGYSTTGGSKPMTASKGFTTNNIVSGRNYNVPIVRGTGGMNASPGGRGM